MKFCLNRVWIAILRSFQNPNPVLQNWKNRIRICRTSVDREIYSNSMCTNQFLFCTIGAEKFIRYVQLSGITESDISDFYCIRYAWGKFRMAVKMTSFQKRKTSLKLSSLFHALLILRVQISLMVLMRLWNGCGLKTERLSSHRWEKNYTQRAWKSPLRSAIMKFSFSLDMYDFNFLPFICWPLIF